MLFMNLFTIYDVKDKSIGGTEINKKAGLLNTG